MSGRVDNPFRITKSNDLVDEQIDLLWVSAGEGEEEITSFTRLNSPMAMFVLGGKGSGKSHLMRHHSFALQSIRFNKAGLGLVDGVTGDGYVGIYARCGGLDSHRFGGKGQGAQLWSDLFAYYFELWVADKTLAALETVCSSERKLEQEGNKVSLEIGGLFDRCDRVFNRLSEVRDYLAELRRQLDYAVNNAALSNELKAEVLVSRGRLFFGIPSLASQTLTSLRDVQFIYLLDEFENFTEDQQMYLNTLIREREGPTAFKIGARLYGVRTHRTYSGGETNREGSEYEELRLDERFRNAPERYREFALKLIARRLSSTFGVDIFEKDPDALVTYFIRPDLTVQSPYLLSLFDGQSERPHLVKFRQKLSKGLADGFVIGPRSGGDLDELVKSVSFDGSPLMEKLCLLFLYQQWFRSADLVAASRVLRENAESYLNGTRDGKFAEFVRKHTGDMVAQLLRENNGKQNYSGLNNFIRMSEGLPRTLLTILKRIFDWSVYMEENPFSGGKISFRAQQKGIAEASDWFLEHMLEEGDRGLLVRSSVDRLSRLFRANRFADKPIETSMIAISVDDIQLHHEARDTIRAALNTSILIDISRGQRERNSEAVSRKLELNTMLSPRYDLPIARRGVATLSNDQANAVFVYSYRESFEELLKDWEAKMTAPYFNRSAQPKKDPNQPDLFE
ncbi:hypothetical protein [Bradyrhizobium sp. RP6]|uniref:ORC-CDC6 family AAA ATPase n=1 Tax=Bradyrhizobium sp. RP6 TaxID=2489596 RepID=UPI000F522C37|nr:hypothetical protein [Bradyrhizobium sp. RP6]RQH12741.1 hypothetical protein EHH60_14745 [Bradyrhizobium sp. RP6]